MLEYQPGSPRLSEKERHAPGISSLVSWWTSRIERKVVSPYLSLRPQVHFCYANNVYSVMSHHFLNICGVSGEPPTLNVAIFHLFVNSIIVVF